MCWRPSVEWHLSLPLMNSFNKTEAAFPPCWRWFLWAFLFSQNYSFFRMQLGEQGMPLLGLGPGDPYKGLNVSTCSLASHHSTMMTPRHSRQNSSSSLLDFATEHHTNPGRQRQGKGLAQGPNSVFCVTLSKKRRYIGIPLSVRQSRKHDFGYNYLFLNISKSNFQITWLKTTWIWLCQFL